MNLHLILPLVQAVFSLGLMLLVIRRNFGSSVHRLLFVYLLLMTVWGLLIFSMRASPDLELAHFWEKTLIPISPFMAVVFYHFSIRFTERTAPKWLLPALYFVCISFLAVSRTDLIIEEMQRMAFGYAAVGGAVFPVLILFLYSVLALAFLKLLQSFRKSSSAEIRNRSAYILAGLCISLLGGFFDVLPILGLPFYPGAIIGNIFFCVLTTTAIIKHQLLDIHIVVRKGTAYLLTSAAVAIPYIGVILIFNQLTDTMLPYWSLIVILILLALGLQPLWSKMQNLVDKMFYRDRYDFLKALGEFTEESRKLSDPDKVGTSLVGLIKQALQASSVNLLLPDASENFTAIASEGDKSLQFCLISQNPLLYWLKTNKTLLYRKDMDTHPLLQSISREEMNALDSIKPELFVPVLTKEAKLVGVIILGEKISQLPYYETDEKLIMTVTDRMSMELENARLFRDAIQTTQNMQIWLNSMTDCVFTVNSEFRIRYMNQAATKHFGKKVDGICYETLGKKTKCDGCPLESERNNGGKELIFSLNVNNREYGRTVTPLLDAKDRDSVIEVLKDITQVKQIENERQRIEKLESIGVLAGGIAHDFNNLLTGIMGNIELVKRHMSSREISYEWLEEAEKASTRARDLTQQLLTFARGGRPVKKLVFLPDLIRDTATFALRGSNVGLDLSLPDYIWGTEVDEGQINQVIHNIVINADQAMPGGGTLHIGVSNIVIDEQENPPISRGEYVRIEIRDEGIGMSGEQVSRIFEPYYTTKQKGSGLGLATVYSIIKNHDGYITVNSSQGVGTTFTLFLPASKEQAVKREEATPMVEALISNKGRILVMDDEKIIRELLHDELTDVGYAIELTKNGKEAVTRYKMAKEAGQPFDVVILDLTIPGGMGGREVIEELLEIDPDVKAVVSSGYSTDPIMADFEKYGFSAVASKPYRLEELNNVLKDIIQKK